MTRPTFEGGPDDSFTLFKPEVAPVGGWEGFMYRAEEYAQHVAEEHQVDLVRAYQMISHATFDQAYQAALDAWMYAHADEPLQLEVF